MEIKYRLANKKDKNKINKLFIEMISSINEILLSINRDLIQGFESGYKDNYLDGYFINKKRVIYLAIDNDIIVGFISVEIYDDYTYFDDFSVTKNYRGKGIGSNLISIAEKYSLDNGNKEIRLHAQSCNENSISFYERRNYKKEKNGKR